MADSLAQLLAGAAKTNADFDFNKILEAYWKGQEEAHNVKKRDWEGLEQAYKQRTRDAFQDPSLYGPDGQPDPTKVVGAGLRAGGLPGAEGTSKAGDAANTSAQYGNAERARQRLQGTPPTGNIDIKPTNPNAFPPSMNRQSSTTVAPDLTQKGPQGVQGAVPTPSVAPEFKPQRTAGGDKANSIIGFLTAHNVPPDRMGKDAIILSNLLKIDPNASLNPNDPNTREVLGKYITNLRVSAAAPQQAPQAQPPVPGPQMGPAGAQAAVPPIAPPPATFNDRFGPMQPPQQAPNAPIQPVPVQTIPIRPQAQAQPPVAPQPQGPPPDERQYPGGPTLGGIISAGELRQFGTPEAVLAAYEAEAQGNIPKEYKDVLQKKTEAIRKVLDPTEDQKKASAAGMTPRQLMERTEQEKMAQTMLEKTAPQLVDSFTGAKAFKDTINSVHIARAQLDAPGGVITGLWADDKLKALRIAEMLGANVPAISNTQTFNSEMARRIQGMAQTLPGVLSDKDVKFLSSIGGTSELSEATIRRMLDISEQLGRAKIKDHNEQVGKMITIEPRISQYRPMYEVKEPGQYQKKMYKGDILKRNGKPVGVFDGEKVVPIR